MSTGATTRAVCPDLKTALAPAEAHQILLPYFEAVRALFLAQGLSKISRVKLTCSSDMHDTPRHFGGTSQDGLEIVLAPEMVELQEKFVLGIIAHELGHATDFLYPGEFTIGKDDSIIRRERVSVDDTQWLRWQRAWDLRDSYVVEKTADLIAGLVWGTPIGYEGPCTLESFEGGVPRPAALR